MKTNKNEIIMTVAEIIAAINNDTMTVDEIRETVTRTQMTVAEVEAEAADWWGADWHAEDTEEIDEKYYNEYGISLTPDERHDLFLALRAYEPDRKIELYIEPNAAYLSVDYRYSPARPYYQAPAEDANGNKYHITWDILDSFDPATDDDESNACDWDEPAKILDDHNYDVTEHCVIVDR